jgi:cellobiose phosphorylase
MLLNCLIRGIEMSYRYKNESGDFELKSPCDTSYLYFPLANESGVMCSITPDMAGDSKMSQNTFLLPPVSCENLHNDRSSRNIWCVVDGKPFSLTGRSASQLAERGTSLEDETLIEAGMMHHKITRKIKEPEIEATVENFVPASGELFELMKVTVHNSSDKRKQIQIITAIPIYGRSADNIRDHRHVTSLLHRIRTVKRGIIVKPTMSFDERGHKENDITYGVFAGNKGVSPVCFFPVLEDFIGEGGNLEHPGAIYNNENGHKTGYFADGYEAIGAIQFENKELAPGENAVYIIAAGYGNSQDNIEESAEKLLDENIFDEKLGETIKTWNNRVNIHIHSGDGDFDKWMRWVGLQPMLRRIYGCSFLPHHDYGKGGRGWRDLWQDCLALIMMNPDVVRDMILNNFCGVRIDGTNATIIGNEPGEFVADRNHIKRVWMDHGVWPLITTELYINQTGDIRILLADRTYFRDSQINRGETDDNSWNELYGVRQLKEDSAVYYGTILEHILLENLTAFYDVGEHNHIRIRNADWNDALDMAYERGESVAFTAMYADNLEQIANLIKELEKIDIDEIELLEEMDILLWNDTTDYNNVSEKKKILYRFCSAVSGKLKGNRKTVSTKVVRENLMLKAEWIRKHISDTEWIEDGENRGWFNSYYDNSGRQLEGIDNGTVRMMLTGQVFTIMSNTASQNQIHKIMKAADAYLYNKSLGGYRLNTDFKKLKMDMGRMFGFAYGHKENGAVFSHMTTMLGNALYQRNESDLAYNVIASLYEHCRDFESSKIYPGIPEYFDPKGRGMYHYLTGAASWMLLTVVREMYGVKGHMGDMLLQPKLLGIQFDKNGYASVELPFSGKNCIVLYHNEKKVDKYAISKILINGDDLIEQKSSEIGSLVPKTIIENCDGKVVIQVELEGVR